MGSKSSNFMQSDRPESGGADKDGIREKNGLLERNKEKFASEQAHEHEHDRSPEHHPGEEKPGQQ